MGNPPPQQHCDLKRFHRRTLLARINMTSCPLGGAIAHVNYTSLQFYAFLIRKLKTNIKAVTNFIDKILKFGAHSPSVKLNKVY